MGMTKPQTFELKPVTESGHPYIGQITGQELAGNEGRDVTVYWTDDGRACRSIGLSRTRKRG
jgi:hypothetical protein